MYLKLKDIENRKNKPRPLWHPYESIKAFHELSPLNPNYEKLKIKYERKQRRKEIIEGIIKEVVHLKPRILMIIIIVLLVIIIIKL